MNQTACRACSIVACATAKTCPQCGEPWPQQSVRAMRVAALNRGIAVGTLSGTIVAVVTAAGVFAAAASLAALVPTIGNRKDGSHSAARASALPVRRQEAAIRSFLAANAGQIPVRIERRGDLPSSFTAVPIQLWPTSVAVHREPRQDAAVLDYLTKATHDMHVWSTRQEDGRLKLHQWRNGWLLVAYSRDVDDRSVCAAGWVWGGDVIEPLHRAYRFVKPWQTRDRPVVSVVHLRTVDDTHCEVISPDGTRFVDDRKNLIYSTGAIAPTPPMARGL